MTPEEVAKYDHEYVSGQCDALASLIGIALRRLGFTETSDEISRLLAFAEVAVREYPKTASTEEESLKLLAYVMARRNIIRTVVSYMGLNYARCSQCGNSTNPAAARFCTQCGMAIVEG